jgi:hypothetical protein
MQTSTPSTTDVQATPAAPVAVKKAAAKPAAKATTKAAVKAVAKTAVKVPAKAAAKPAAKAPAKAAPKAAAKKAVAKPAVKATAKPATKTEAKPAAKPAAKAAPKAPKEKKIKMVRDSISIPKTEYAVLDDLKLRAGKLGVSVKKTELLRAGIKALAALSDVAFLSAVRAVPNLKTGRPSKAD